MSGQVVGLLGTGDVSCALGRGLLLKGYKIVFGTRSANVNDEKLGGLLKTLVEKAYENEKSELQKLVTKDNVSIASFADAAKKAEFSFLALNWEQAGVIVCKEIADSVSGIDFFCIFFFICMCACLIRVCVFWAKASLFSPHTNRANKKCLK